MTAKEYLRQLLQMDKRVNAKLEQLEVLKEMAVGTTAVLSDMPKGSTNIRSSEDIIAKLMDLETEINSEVDALVDMKAEAISVINSLEDANYISVLTQRYISDKTWEDIANKMHYSLRWVYVLHSRAIAELDKILNKESA